jgi:hypothetical protein
MKVGASPQHRPFSLRIHLSKIPYLDDEVVVQCMESAAVSGIQDAQ